MSSTNTQTPTSRVLCLRRPVRYDDQGTVWLYYATIWDPVPDLPGDQHGRYHGRGVQVAMDHRVARQVHDLLTGMPNETDGLLVHAEPHQIFGWPVD